VDNYSYKVEKAGTSPSKEGSTTPLEATVSGLEPGATYIVSVKANKNTVSSTDVELSGVTLGEWRK
jgi:hypothetical protein